MKGIGILWCEIPNQERLLRFILPPRDDDRPAVVYWLHDESCIRPGYDGYVGVTYKHRLASRLNEHKRSKRFKGRKFAVMILLEDHVNSCYLYEFVLRPTPHIGWNVAMGGARGSKCGIPKNDVTKRKIGNANRGRKRPDLSERNRLNKGQHFSDVTCPYCHLVGSGPNMKRYHFENCKRKIP
jgi:hypothetical protein